MKAVFLGTPEAAVPSLRALAGIADVRAVVTRPDRPRGRSGRPVPSEVAGVAEELGLPVVRPENSGQLGEAIVGLGPIEVGLVVAFGMILRPEVLTAARFVNVHFSLLPRWRGAAPVQRAVMAGDSRTGVSLMAMDEGLDTGPILATHSTAIGAREDAEALTRRLADMGGDLVARWLPALHSLAAAPQNEALATLAPKLTGEERWLDPATTGVESAIAAVRGLTPWPGAWVRHATGRLRLKEVGRGTIDGPPGILRVVDGALELVVRDGSIRLDVVQPEGRRAMPGMDWARGRGADLGSVT
ncbi:MAG TPA: methionyl-tRNA formyltransferase [Acidimicrobiia bacterium]|nr:methionyl-tRNA formyltransferase [Acidimicrobiia bacterium]